MVTQSFRLAGASLALIFCLLVHPGGYPVYAEDVNVAISSVGLYEIPLEIAKRKGFYKEEGLKSRPSSSEPVCRRPHWRQVISIIQASAAR